MQSKSKETESRIIQLPLLDGQWASLQIPVPMSDDDWDQMHKVLDAMKPGLVRSVPKEEIVLQLTPHMQCGA